MASSEAKQRDRLTGAASYEAFVQAVERGISEADEANGCLSLALVDVDEFKAVNDKHGMPAGDGVLKATGDHLVEAAAGQGSVFRYSKDEFAVLLPDMEKEHAFLLLERARCEFDEDRAMQAEAGTIQLRVTFSAGVASFPDDGGRYQELVRKAGDALHRAKTSGRNKVCLAREERMATKTSHYTQGQLARLSQLAETEGIGEAVLLREALDDLLRKYAM